MTKFNNENKKEKNNLRNSLINELADRLTPAEILYLGIEELQRIKDKNTTANADNKYITPKEEMYKRNENNKKNMSGLKPECPNPYIDNSYFSKNALAKSRQYITKHEGFRAEAYKPNDKDVWTIGYGHTKNVKPGDKITEEEAESLFREDFKEHTAPLKKVKIPLSDNEKVALASLIYNIGPNAFLNSTLFKKLNKGDKKGAAEEFKVWNRDNNGVSEGLTRRRKEDLELFLTPDN